MRVLLLAGGRGRRLEPYTAILPKPLAPIGELPIIEIIVRQLHRDGLTEVVASIGHLGELIVAYFAARPLPRGLSLTFVRETEPLGTAGPLSLVARPGESLLVVNGDVLTELRFDQVVATHEREKPAMTVAVNRRGLPIEFGVVEAEDGRVSSIREKPVIEHDCCMGVNVYGPEAIEIASRGGAVDFPDVVNELLGRSLAVRTHRFDGFWCDIGRRDDMVRANEEFERRRDALLPTGELEAM
ncbi:MAG: sugar phosphate nucleotidyltransferase [Thermoanaerobaculia bacterium]|jgi:NDP-sugar pyrophosphorylase family protein